MNTMKKSNIVPILLVLPVLFLCSVSCEKEFKTVGTDIIPPGNFELSTTYADVFAYNRKINAVQTNGLPIYQLGRYTDPLYGETQAQIATQLSLQLVNPTFGTYSQELEDGADTDDNTLTIEENETVTAVYLNIPFFSRLVDTDEDGNRTFELDSILGNQNANFNLRVEELTYYLSDLDPQNNFETPLEYFSDHDFSTTTGDILFDNMYVVNPNEVVIFNEDDPETEENEAETVLERLDPRVRVSLDPAFFQQRIMDAEGTEFLANSNNFEEYLRGLYISTSSFTDDLLMLLDLSQANIEIRYEYDRVDNMGTPDDTSDDEIVTDDSAFLLNFSGNIINTYTNAPYPVSVSDELNTNTNASRLYLKGGAGTFVEIRLFDGDGSNTNLDEIRANNWLINEANLTFYVDRTTIDGYPTLTEPERIYLYDMESRLPILDHLLDRTTNTANPDASKTVYGGILERNEEAQGVRYKIRVTQHINNIIRKDSTNVRLGLVLTSNVNNIDISTAILEPADEIGTTRASIVNPFGTVLHGSDPGIDEALRLRLEIYYTEFDN